MGIEFHITRAELWAENELAPISREEWLRYVESDPELSLTPGSRSLSVRWSGPSRHEDPWLEGFQGNVYTKWPDTALFEKMLRIADALGARVQDDDGTLYTQPGDWTYDPSERVMPPPPPSPPASPKPPPPVRRPWWQRLWGRA